MKIFYIAAFAKENNYKWFSLGRMRKVEQVVGCLLDLGHQPELLNIAPFILRTLTIGSAKLNITRLCSTSFVPARIIELLYNSSRHFAHQGESSSRAAIWTYNTRVAESIVAIIALLLRPQLKLILQLEDLPSARLANHGLRGSLDRLTTLWLSKRADRVFAVSKQVASSFSKLTSSPIESITILPPALDPHFLKLVQERDQPFSSAFITIFYAGSFSQEKGVNDLIEAFLSLRSPQFKLVLAGSAPRSLVQACDRHNSIKFLGIVTNDDLFRLYASSDIVVNPHRPILNSDHIFPFKLIETVASGALPLTTPMPGSECLGLPSECFFRDVGDLKDLLLAAPALWNKHQPSIEMASIDCRNKYSTLAIQNSVASALASL